ncbi:hypothetical protein E3N88_25501 [Mikania micrantha]|uniref:Uncharacterized protein n=1 Tax=Mikania micrantha TaxID=192012 RepID=A0A5N6N6E6_9ASTR|nr:hypothetical protein E3N88_25501 [Mikania micrantha]
MRKDGPPLSGSSQPKSVFNSRSTEKGFQPRSEGFHLGSSTKPGSSLAIDSGQSNSRERGVRSLSRTEWEERRKKGLCFRCGQQFGPTHKCPEGKLRILLLGDDEIDSSEGAHWLLEADGTGEPPDSTLTGTCLALESAGLLVDTGGAKTLRFEGELQGISVSMMVDSGATHNFVSQRLVLALGLPVCSNGLVTILGEVVHDWQKAWMKFTHEGHSVMLHGNTWQQPVKAGLNQWLATNDVLAPPTSGHSQLTISNPSSLTPVQLSDISTILTFFESIFLPPSGLPPLRSHAHSIILNSSAPVCVRPYRYPHIQKSEIERQVSELLQLGMIRPSKSSYSSPVILVQKKDNSWRMCVDYHALNEAIVPDKYPIPVVDEL